MLLELLESAYLEVYSGAAILARSLITSCRLVVDAEPFRASGLNDATEQDKLHRASGAGQSLLAGLLSRGSKDPQPTDATVRDHVDAYMGYRA